MRGWLWIAATGMLAASSPAFADEGKNFVVTVNGKDYPVDLGETVTVKDKAGDDMKLVLRQSDIGTFHGDLISFQHGKELSVTSTDLQSGLKQHMMATNRGTLVLVQEYADIDPRSLAELMLKQISKDDVRDGGSLDKEQTKRKISDGTTLEGLKGKVSVKKGLVAHTVRYEVLTGGTSDHGIVAVTRIDSDASADDQKALDRFWESLTVKF